MTVVPMDLDVFMYLCAHAQIIVTMLGLGRVSIRVSFRLIRVRLGLVCGHMGLSAYQIISLWVHQVIPLYCQFLLFTNRFRVRITYPTFNPFNQQHLKLQITNAVVTGRYGQS